MARVYDGLHLSAIGVGSCALLTDIGSNVQWMQELTGTLWDTNILMTVVIGIGGALSLSFTYKALREKQPVSGVAMLALWVGCLVFSGAATADRVSSSKDRAQSAKIDHTLIQTKQTACEGYHKARDDALAAGAYEQKTPAHNAAMDKLLIHKGRCDRATKALAKAHQSSDALGHRLQRVTKGLIEAEDASIYVPLIAPLCLLLMGSVVLAWGVNGREESPEFQISDPKAEAEAKAIRYVQAYQSQANGNKPSIEKIREASGVSHAVARRVRSEA